MELMVSTPLHEGSVLSFEEFFEAEHDRPYRALCLITRSRHEARSDIFAVRVG
jgi:hypothetical protein